jgi:flagella basal body P-ring formation protein FlgA
MVPVVGRDTAVILVHEAPGLTLTAQGRALEDGIVGAVVPVLNLSNGGVVLAEVLGRGRARALGASPTTALSPMQRMRLARRDAP